MTTDLSHLDGAQRIAEERARQKAMGYGTSHDDEHDRGELVWAARAYAAVYNLGDIAANQHTADQVGWPFVDRWNPSPDPIRNWRVHRRGNRPPGRAGFYGRATTAEGGEAMSAASGWTATIWATDEKHWYARYFCGVGSLNDGPGCPWVDHARSRERIEKKAAATLKSLNPPPPLIQFKMSAAEGPQP